MEEVVATLRQGQILGKDFKVLRPLAAGGMGAVYLVEQLSTGRERALKVMHPQFVKSEDSRARFTQEAKVGAKIRSDHVVEVVSAGVDDDTGIPWLAMELLDGEELAKRVQRKKCLQPQETLEIFRQLCHALGEAHRNGLVHRDLKPQNIFMARSRRQGEAFTVKILDFGVAKLVQESQGDTDHTKPVGTPRWMAPEQSDAGAAIRPATDVWALGLIAFNCLTGKYYWKSANLPSPNLTALLRELVVEPIAPASQRAAELGCTGAMPRGFDDWFARCMERDPHRRLQDASVALEALVPVLSSAPGWKPITSEERVLDDSATTPEPMSALATPPVPQHTPQAQGDDDSETVRWGRLAVKPAPQQGQSSTRPFAQPPAPHSGQTLTEPMAAPSKLPMIAGLGAGLIAIAIAGVALLRKPPPPAPVAAAPAPMPDAFTAVFDSFPSGADLMEGESKLGTTPMQLSLRNAGLDASPRKFRIVRAGFLPYEVVQGPSREPVRVLATLAPDPAAAAAQKTPDKKPEPPPEKPRRHAAEGEEAPELRTRR